MVAVIVGIIPESGPHLIFVTMYANSSIPLSILIASSIAQDGHAMLPLIAISKRSFILVKLINMVVAFIIGYICLNLF
jgi:putative 10TM heavy-metal exporter